MIDANVHRHEAENEVGQLKLDFFVAEQAMLEARETAKKYEMHYCETLIELEQARAGSPTATNRADQVLIHWRSSLTTLCSDSTSYARGMS